MRPAHPYRWFQPLLRMDTVPKFVQLIKLVQQETRIGQSGCARRASCWPGRNARRLWKA